MSTHETREPRDALAELLAQQAQLRGWMERLDDEAGDVPAHVTARVRADYETRLAGLVDQLRDHAEGIREELARLREAVVEARDTHQRAADDLAEARLRYRLGEWGPEDWEPRRTDLERTVAEASEREAELSGEAARCEGLLEQIDAPASAEPPLPELLGSTPASEALAEPDGWGPPPETLERDPDLAFLEGLDRAMATPRVSAEAVDVGASAPPAGIKCRECGYTNDPTAAFCGVCGVDLS